MESEETLFTAKACLGKKVFKQYEKILTPEHN